MPLPLHVTDVGGIPTVWTQSPCPYTGTLSLRVGTIDERLTDSFVVNLVEQLVMTSLPGRHPDWDSFVCGTRVTFHASGTKAEVGEFLAEVCRLLTRLPINRLADAAGQLAERYTEDEPEDVQWSAFLRYGNTGLGRVAAEGPRPTQITAEQVQEFHARAINRGRAALTFTGPPPSDPRITLPAGPPDERPRSVPTGLPTPGYRHARLSAPVLSFLTESSAAAVIARGILLERVRRALVEGRAIAYGVSFSSLLVEHDLVLNVLSPQGPAGGHGESASTLVALFEALTQQAPTEAEVDTQRQRLLASVDDVDMPIAALTRASADLLLGKPVAGTEAELAEILAVTPAACHEIMRLARDTALLGVPEGVTARVGFLPNLDHWLPEQAPAVEGESFRAKGRFGFYPKEPLIVLGPHGFTLTHGGRRRGGAWSDVAGVRRHADQRTIVLANGDEVLIDARAYARPDHLLAELDARTKGRQWEVEPAGLVAEWVDWAR